MPAHRTRNSLSLPSVSLEVKTDAPQPPCVSIISPTPRAFTFPINIHDGPTPRAFTFPAHVQDTPITGASPQSPCPSPSLSPFEPDLSSLAITHRTFSPQPQSPIDAPVASGTSAPPSHRRRGSTCASIERKPKKGDEDYIKRPENAFILFRRECCMQKNAAEAAGGSDSQSQRRQRQADLSKMISQQWKSLPADERAYWDELAKQKKKEHEEMYPWYVYQPTRSKEKARRPSVSKPKSRKGKSKASSVTDSDDMDFADTDDSESVSFAAPNPSGAGRRATSAPTPPPPYYAGIRLPTLLSPSCPSSPALQGVARPQTRLLAPPDLATQFQFLPSEILPRETLLQPVQFPQESMDMSGQVPDYTSNLHSSSMFANFYEPHQQVLGDKSNGRTYPAITIPNTPPRNTLSLQQQVSPTASVASTSPGPSTPQRLPYAFASQYSPAVQSPLSSPAQPGPSSTAAADSPKEPCNTTAAATTTTSGWDAYDLPAWALPTLWPNLDANFQMFGDAELDIAAIPPLSLELPPSATGHDGSAEGQDDFTDPLFGLQFRFEDLLDSSQL